ncbi:MAG: PD-(D/E)XK nuclease family protein [Flavobacteriales bacterium]|nr:PD-(D/E)XK nuclease family protein [Flavobacteriales bacterium]
MDTFLGELADLLLAEYGKDLSQVTVVLPSQRAGLHLRHELARRAKSALWSPRTTTLNGLCERIGGMRTGNSMDLLFEAHAEHLRLEGAKASPLNEFLQWAPTALRDMSEVDAHRIDLDAFYRDLRNWEELDWSFRADDLSQGQERMLRYWHMKGALHRALDQRWREQGHGTGGLVERVAAEQATKPGNEHPAIWAAGLNALNVAQLDVLKALQVQGCLQVAWDTDEHYLADAAQEAGDAVRSAIAALGPGRIAPRRSLRTLQRTIRVIHTPVGAAQALYAAARLGELSDDERARTAVVLADEQLLMPLLEALPGATGPINVTMGMPLRALPVGALINALLTLHRDAHPAQGPSLTAIEKVIGHPFIAQGLFGAWARKASSALQQRRRSHVPYADLRVVIDELDEAVRDHGLAALGAPATDGAAIGSALLALIAFAQASNPSDAFIQEQLYLAAVAHERMDRLVRAHCPGIDGRSYAELHQRIQQEQRLGLFGEPLAGAQLMGMLETRALDPGRIILLSAQEGHLPPSAMDKSFIPHELRRHHHLPSRHDQEAVSAYHFMRLIQRCPDVTLVCPDGAEQGESRFIRQLELELVPASNTELGHSHLQSPVPHRASAGIAVQKDQETLRLLRERLEKGISPSALATFLRCPLDLLLSHFLGAEEREQPSGMIAPDLLGNAIHKAFELAYNAHVERPLTVADMAAIRKESAAHLEHLLEQEFGRELLAHGQPLLQRTMALKALDAFMGIEEERLGQGALTTVLGLEQAVNVPIPGALERFGFEVRIKGRIDRIDRRDGLVTILDLKTGKAKEDSLRVKDPTVESLRAAKDHHGFQLLTYAFAYLEARPEEEAVAAAILPLQQASRSGGLLLQFNGEERITRTDLPMLRSLLLDIVAELLDPAVPFTHNSKSSYCKACVG